MHKNTYEILYDSPGDDCFIIDELIALPIQVLNRKGYFTEFCCAGHPFENDWDEFDSMIVFKEGISLPLLPTGWKVFDNLNPDIVWSNVPEGQEHRPELDKRLHIEKIYPNLNRGFYVIYLDILKSMEELYTWALKLPNYAGNL